MAETMTGGCQCGRVRYELAGADDEAYLCHCKMCQHATGGVAAALKQVKVADVTWTNVPPERYRSSRFAQRGFCRECGTPLTWESDGDPGMDLTVGSFDDPYRLKPVLHAGAESIHEAWLDTSGLPRHRTDENAKIVAKWMESRGRLPD